MSSTMTTSSNPSIPTCTSDNSEFLTIIDNYIKQLLSLAKPSTNSDRSIKTVTEDVLLEQLSKMSHIESILEISNYPTLKKDVSAFTYGEVYNFAQERETVSDQYEFGKFTEPDHTQELFICLTKFDTSKYRKLSYSISNNQTGPHPIFLDIYESFILYVNICTLSNILDTNTIKAFESNTKKEIATQFQTNLDNYKNEILSKVTQKFEEEKTTLISQIDVKANEFKDAKKNLLDEHKQANSSFLERIITVISIFAAIVFTFVTSATYFSSMLNSIATVNFGRLLGIGALAGFIDFNLMAYLFRFLRKYSSGEYKDEYERRKEATNEKRTSSQETPSSNNSSDTSLPTDSTPALFKPFKLFFKWCCSLAKEEPMRLFVNIILIILMTAGIILQYIIPEYDKSTLQSPPVETQQVQHLDLDDI